MIKCYYHFRFTQFHPRNFIMLNEKNIISKDNRFINHLISRDQKNIQLVL